MMKKMLVLALVLAVAGLTNAGLVLSNETPSVGIITGADNTAALGGFLVVKAGAVTPQLVFTGSLGEIIVADAETKGAFVDLVGAFSELYQFNFADGSGTPKLPNGILARFTGATLPATLIMTDGDGVQLGQPVTLVPEPMTMALLGLGGLFLRKRK